MGYHISTGLIKEKFREPCECPLCAIKRKVEENFLYEFLNDAVMEDTTRMTVNEKGFCDKHFDMLFKRQNKLSLALQIGTHTDRLMRSLGVPKNEKEAKKLAAFINEKTSSCVICELVEESMEKYYKTIAQMFTKESDFAEKLSATKGFCLPHYAKLLEYANYAGGKSKEYISLLATIESEKLYELKSDLKAFCDKHDYRNAYKPLGTAETALPRMRIRLYGEKKD
ncbi:MAG: DUF6062 family protein [Clostridia bacterium]|nr:DUF6062 family protein [Clostridia bacterium]